MYLFLFISIYGYIYLFIYLFIFILYIYIYLYIYLYIYMGTPHFDASSFSLLELPLDTPYTTMSMKLQQNEKRGCDEPGL